MTINCSRNGCDSPAVYYNPVYGYLCEDCMSELVTRIYEGSKRTSIDEFMQLTKGDDPKTPSREVVDTMVRESFTKLDENQEEIDSYVTCQANDGLTQVPNMTLDQLDENILDAINEHFDEGRDLSEDLIHI